MDGEPVKAVAAMRTDGYLFLFNRETGEPLLPIEERPVPQDAHQRTAPTQPFPTRTESILPECSYWRDRVPPPFQLSCSSYTPPSVDEQTVVAPGVPIPLVRVTPMAFSPQTGYNLRPGARACRPRPPLRGPVRLEHGPVPPDAARSPRHPRGSRRADRKHRLEEGNAGRSFSARAVPWSPPAACCSAVRPGGQVEAYDVPDRRPPVGVPHQ